MSPSRGGRPRHRAANPDVRKQYMGRLSPERPPLLAANVEQPAPQIRGRVRPCLSHSDGPAKAPKLRGLEIRSAGPGTSFRASLSDKKGETIKSFDHGAWLQIYRGRCLVNLPQRMSRLHPGGGFLSHPQEGSKLPVSSRLVAKIRLEKRFVVR